MTQKTDKKLLELAAKVAGIEWQSYDMGRGLCLTQKTGAMVITGMWNPLKDDGDALRLAVKLEIEIRVFNGKSHAGKTDRFWCTEIWFPDGDINAATRRAIVRAAADLWEGASSMTSFPLNINIDKYIVEKQ